MDAIGDRRQFDRLPGGGYAYTLLDDAVRVEVRHLRRDHHQLHGECDVLCDWSGVLRYHSSLSRADLNLSSQSARKALAKHCAERARTKPDDFDWMGVIDASCLEIIQAERQGTADLVLDDAPTPAAPQELTVHGISLQTDSHGQLIADGGGLKSLIELLILGELARREIPVLFCDWEWNAVRHLGRKRRLFGTTRLPHLHYMQCVNPLAVELDHIRRACDAHQIQVVGIDSIGACVDGKLADDDVARAYNRCLSQLPATLAAAHIPKSVADPTVGCEGVRLRLFS
jgi:hypothetical protein